MKILKIVAGIIVVLIVGVVIVLMTVDVSKYKGVIQDQAKAATGREVTIGDIKLSLSLSPAVVVSDVKVANAPWGSRPEMLTLKRLEAHTQLIPLLFGKVNISGLKLVEPDAVLETNAEGKGNWEFDTKAPAPADPNAKPEEGGSLPLNISGVNIEGLKLVYKDGKTKGGANLAAKTIDVKVDGALTDLNIPSVDLAEVAGSYKQGGMDASGTVGKMNLKAVGPITDVNLTKFVLSDAKGSYKDGPTSYEGAVANLTMEGAGGDRPASKKIDIPASIKALMLTKLSIDNASGSMKDAKTTASATIGKVAVDAKGKLGDMGITNIAVSDTKATYKGEGAPMDVAIEKLSLDEKGALTFAAKLSGQDLKASGTLAPIASLTSQGKSFPAKLDLEGFGLKGKTDIIVDMSGKRPSAKGSVTIPELDLAAYTKADAKAAPAAPAKSGGRMFSDEPLPWDQLNAADAKVNLQVGKLKLPNGIELSNVAVPVDLVAGKLGIKPASFGVAGGTVSADVDADAGAKSFALKVDAKNITAETIAKDLKKGDLIKDGPVDLAVNVRGAGNSIHGLMAGLNGSVIFGMGESKIRSEAMNFIGGDALLQVLNIVNPMANKDPYTVARCTVVNLQITGGVANTNNGIALVTDKMQITSSGKIDLGNEQVDLNVRPKATGGLGIGLGSIVQAVKVQGPLASPGVGIDKAGAVKSLATLGAAFATGGGSLLAQSAADKAQGQGGDPCQIARTWHLKK